MFNNLINKLFSFNIYKLQLLMPVILAASLYIHTSVHTLLLLTGFFLIISSFNHMVVNKLILCFIIGLTRGYFIEQMPEHYTYKRTSFSAQIIDIETKEHGIYLKLENFKYKQIAHKQTIDELPIFPKIAKMRIVKLMPQTGELATTKKELKNEFDLKEFQKIEAKINPGTKIIAIGRFMLETPSPIGHVGHMKLPLGIIDKFEIIKQEKATFKTKLRNQYNKYLSKNSAQLAKAIFLGDTFAINTTQRKKFQEAGISHLLGVSVLNIAIIALVCYLLIKSLISLLMPQIGLLIPLNVLSQTGAILITLGYCYIVGFEYPLLRSLLMSSFSLIALYFGQKRNKEALLWSGAFILLANPFAIYDIGFELSFGAVLGICCAPKNLIAPKLRNNNNQLIKLAQKILNVLISSVYSTLFASSIIIPISLYQFHTTSIQPFLANIIAIPFVSFIIMPISLIATIAALFNFSFIIIPLMKCLDLFLIFFEKIAVFFIPFGINIHVDPIENYGTLLFVLSIILFSIFKKPARYIFLTAGICAFGISVIKRHKAPMILIHPYAIGLILDDKIIAYPKCNFISDVWQQAYAKKCISGKNLPIEPGSNKYYFLKDKCSKIVILGKYGLFFQQPKCACTIDTKENFIIPYGQQLKQVNIIKLHNE